jgi:hypothetical protein
MAMMAIAVGILRFAIVADPMLVIEIAVIWFALANDLIPMKI